MLNTSKIRYMSGTIEETTEKPRAWGAAIAVAAFALIAGGGVWGASALTQPATEPPATVIETPEPTPTVTPNIDPTATITSATPADLTITVEGAATDTDGTIASQGWNFGDGAFGTGNPATHTYAAEGTYTVTYSVTDDRGGVASATTQVTVTAPPPPPAPAPAPAPAPKQNTGGGGAPTYGQYPPGHPMPMLPGTDAPDTSACASSSGYTDSSGVARCA